MSNALAVVSVTDRLDAAAPPFAPLPPSLDPPAPPIAVCDRTTLPPVTKKPALPPVVDPLTAFVIVELAPAAAVPPSIPLPPLPPVCVALANAVPLPPPKKKLKGALPVAEAEAVA